LLDLQLFHALNKVLLFTVQSLKVRRFVPDPYFGAQITFQTPPFGGTPLCSQKTKARGGEAFDPHFQTPSAVDD